MICYQCGHQIKSDLAKFCDHCGSNLETKPKTSFAKREILADINDEMDRATNLFLLWNGNIVATFIFYIIHVITDNYTYLFLLVLLMLTLSWLLLLIKLHDLTIRKDGSIKEFILMNFCIPILGTFYSFIKLTGK
jgi:DNA-directed RNA polymerase subunit RPC12/RpoP